MWFRSDSPEDKSLTFPEVFTEEKKLLEAARVRRGVLGGERPIAQDLIGLAFSGGGIRSATFNLGVIQALAKKQLLKHIDYLSTVSGGGYIGSWLSSWAYHVKQDRPGETNQIAQVEQELNRSPSDVGDIAEPHEVHFLRKYSNYMTPRLGAFSGDTLAFLGIYLRNLLLNQIILISVMLSILLVPHALALVLSRFCGDTSTWVSALIALASLLVAIVGVALNTDSHQYKSSNVFYFIAAPIFGFSLLATYVLWHLARVDLAHHWRENLSWMEIAGLITAGAVLYSLVWLVGIVLDRFREVSKPLDASGLSKLAPALWGLPTGALASGLLLLVTDWMANHLVGVASNYASEMRCLLAFWVPLVTLLMLIIGVIHLGLIGRAYQDGLREWWARLGGVVLAIAISWCFVCILVFFFPVWVNDLYCFLAGPGGGWRTLWKSLSGIGVTGAITAWAGTTVRGLFAAKGDKTGPRPGSDKSEDMLAQLAPPLFAVGLMAILSIAVYWLVPYAFGVDARNYWLEDIEWKRVLLICAALYAVSRFFGWRVDVNEFSIHNAYRNRLVRCYLGATHRERKPQSFTGFDESDNIFLHDLKELGAPFHIVNATLNVVKGKELALQSRKGRSFTFTPLYSGFDFSVEKSVTEMPGSARLEGTKVNTSDERVHKLGSYRLTETCSWKSRYPGARLGTAMAISGAAVSPNMGHYTTGAVSFLLTVFSVRLGWWLGNPRQKKSWESGHPRSSWRALMRELTGAANEEESEIYLSDGGHFENLAIYELVRRRCRLIISCDSGADPSCACNDLASAIEKCRVDFNTDIEIKLDKINFAAKLFPGDTATRVSESPFTTGTIRYPDGSTGTLIYIKPSLNANLPQDVLAYARIAQSFPHQSTMDQFFDEAQFESYRALGYACATDAIEGEHLQAILAEIHP